MNGISRYSRQQLIEQTTLSKEDMREISQCRRSHSRLGFAYQIGFVRLRNRFPVQSPFEVLDDLLQYTSAQTGSIVANGQKATILIFPTLLWGTETLIGPVFS